MSFHQTMMIWFDAISSTITAKSRSNINRKSVVERMMRRKWSIKPTTRIGSEGYIRARAIGTRYKFTHERTNGRGHGNKIDDLQITGWSVLGTYMYNTHFIIVRRWKTFSTRPMIMNTLCPCYKQTWPSN